MRFLELKRLAAPAMIVLLTNVVISCGDEDPEVSEVTDSGDSETVLSHSVCLNQTEEGPACKDCCDCMDGTADDRTACRDECATHDFTENSNFISHEAPSELGEDGDYSVCVSEAGEAECKACCDGGEAGLICGDFRHCRTACVEEFGGS